MRNRAFKWLSHACRIVLGVTFIFSGFVKTVDPWGTAIKIQEYLSIYGLESLSGLRFGFSIWLCGAELMMGLMLLFKVRIRLISIFALASMIFFTVLTFLSATRLFRRCRQAHAVGDVRQKSGVAAAVGRRLVALPPRPYLRLLEGGGGVHRALLLLGHGAGYLLLCASAADRFQTLQGGGEYLRGDERLFGGPRAAGGEDGADAEGDATESLLTRPGRVYMLCITDSEGLDAPCERRFRGVVERAAAEGALAVCLTPERLRGVTYRSFAGSAAVRCYNIDATTLKTMLRAFNGMVVLDDGTIVEKRNCRDIR